MKTDRRERTQSRDDGSVTRSEFSEPLPQVQTAKADGESSTGPLQRLARATKAYVRSLLQLGLAILAYVPSHALRKAGLRIYGARIASNALIYHGFWAVSPWKLVIGRSTVVGDHVLLDARAGITIGQNVNLSAQAAIWTGQHDYQSPDFAYEEAPVKIEDYAWICFRATILRGVTIGEGAVVAAGAVVTRDVAPYTVVAGVPAHVIGTRNRDLRYDLLKDCNYLRFI